MSPVRALKSLKTKVGLRFFAPMTKKHSKSPLPACYARTLPGLETVAAEEIEELAGGSVKRTGKGLVVFRVPEITRDLLELRTTEDVFLLGWGTDQLTRRAEDLKKIRRWTAQATNWQQLLAIHHSIRPKPKGKPTYHLVTQMYGKHSYLRTGAQKALAQGLAGKFPATWKPADENASIEVWLTIQGKTAYCGLRLSDREMRHRGWKGEHLPASLRPTLAAAMVKLGDARPGQVVLDPMCGAGTILAEQMESAQLYGQRGIQIWGGDIDRNAIRVADLNLRRFQPGLLARWDARALPLPDRSIDRILSNPPFGKQLSDPDSIRPLYYGMIQEYNRILRPGGRAVLLVGNSELLQRAALRCHWESLRFLPVEVLGQSAVMTVWQKP